MTRIVAFDCRYFLGDRPCVWHKREGLLCQCEKYAQIKERLLVIKLDAMGDVLRTTTLLPALAAAHPGAAITWITRPESKPLLENNPYLHEVIAYGPDVPVRLATQTFDRVINLDAGKLSAGLAALAQGTRKDGYFLHADGYIVATNPAASHWLELGVFDDLKKQNQQTYQGAMAGILGLPAAGPYVLELRDEERARAREHFARLGIDPNLPVVGLNTGAGERWALKQWRTEGFEELITRLHRELGAQVLLLGGPGERERHQHFVRTATVPVFDTGNDNGVRHFCALVSLCDAVVAGDTLAMHIALATQRRVVVLFGPTSHAEIELYDQGEKVIPAMDCLVCYKGSCDYQPNCMDLISTDMVFAAVARQLQQAA